MCEAQIRFEFLKIYANFPALHRSFLFLLALAHKALTCEYLQTPSCWRYVEGSGGFPSVYVFYTNQTTFSHSRLEPEGFSLLHQSLLTQRFIQLLLGAVLPHHLEITTVDNSSAPLKLSKCLSSSFFFTSIVDVFV